MSNVSLIGFVVADTGYGRTMALRNLMNGRNRALQFVAAAIAISAASIAGAIAIWMFRPTSQSAHDLWSLLLGDRATVGFVRASIVMLAVYAIGSLAAHLASGRWIRSIGKGGLEIDAASSIEERLAYLEHETQQALTERYELLRLLKESLDG